MMESLSVLRPLQILDTSFQLMRERFVKSYLIALLVTVPLQALVWIVEVAIGDIEDSGVATRTVLLAFILQFFAIGASLSIVSNILAGTVGKAYSKEAFGHSELIAHRGLRMTIALWQFLIQLLFVAAALGFRFFAARILPEDQANVTSFIFFFALIAPWVIITLRSGFIIPVATHEQGTWAELRKRTRAINKKSFWSLVGTHLLCFIIIISLVVPSLTITQIFIANNVIKTDLGTFAYINVIFAIVVAGIALAYSYLLSVTYFNTRIQYEGFDIALSIAQLEHERSERGKSFSSLS